MELLKRRDTVTYYDKQFVNMVPRKEPHTLLTLIKGIIKV
jgi:hypothetical protein